MTADTAILSFLAGRYPAAFDARTVAVRVNRSGMLDAPLSDEAVRDSLLRLARRFGRVELLTNEDGTQFWSATPGGVTAWTLDGSPCVGG